jgi:uncharacterized cupredoxin-like copper-binding protein
MFRFYVLLGLAGLLAAAACSATGGGGREVQITQEESGCTPASVSVKPGEELKLVVKNAAGKDYEIEGIEGTALEETIVPEGRTRSMGYTVPDKAGVYKLKCYVPGDVSTIIELRAEGAAGSDASGDGQQSPGSGRQPGEPAQADTVVKVRLAEYEVMPESATVPAGKVQFIAENVSASMAHELAVLRMKDDGSLENMGEVEDLDPGQSGSVTLDLPAGKYTLACLIAKGEAGSTVDHYKAGMHTEFTVGPEAAARN